MGAWTRWGDGFIKADVIRWKEAVWDSSRKRKGAALRIGERLITAEVVAADGEWVSLLVRECVETARFSVRKPVVLLKAGTVIRRARKTISKYGKPERLLWSDESARASSTLPSAARRSARLCWVTAVSGCSGPRSFSFIERVRR